MNDTDSLVRVHIRWMIRRDMPEVLLAEQASYAPAWEVADFERCLRQCCNIGMVCEAGGGSLPPVVGWMIYGLRDDHLELLRLAVHPDWRRRGVGSQMIEKLQGKLSSHRRNHLVALVPEGNLPAHLFLRSQGFRAVRVLRGAGEPGDLYRFEARLL